MWNLGKPEPSCGTWLLSKMKPLYGTLGNLFVEPQGTGTFFMWNLGTNKSGTFMWNLGEPLCGTRGS